MERYHAFMNSNLFLSLLQHYGDLGITVLIAFFGILYYLNVNKKSKGMSTGQNLSAVFWGKPLILGIIMIVLAAALVFALNHYLATMNYGA